MIKLQRSQRLWSSFILCGALAGCTANVVIPIPDDGDNGDVTVAVKLRDFATGTNGASGLAIRPSDGALFLMNADGLFGPITEGRDVSQLTPIGATNLADPALFDEPQSAFVLAIDGNGEFWIGSNCCSTLAFVPAEGGDAQPFTGLLDDGGNANLLIMPETLAFVPSDFMGTQIMPGNLLVGADTTFSRLAAVDIEGRQAVSVDNSTLDNEDGGLNREAHHLAFGPDGSLYSSRASSSASIAGIQTISTDGTPEGLPGTLRVAAHTYVALDNGDLLINGNFRREGSSREPFRGLFFWSAEDENIVSGLELASADLSENDELVRGQDGTIYLSLPNLNKIVVVEDLRE